MIKIEFNLGLSNKVHIIQISDSHLIFPDKTDGDAYYKRSIERKAFFEREASHRTGIQYNAAERFSYVLEYAKTCKSNCVVLTGDIVDIPTTNNVDNMLKLLNGIPYLYTYGNHDYYINNHGTAVQQRNVNSVLFEGVGNNIESSHITLGEINIVTLDNSTGEISLKQHDFLKSILENYINIMLFMHVPFYSEAIVEKSLKDFNVLPDLCENTGFTTATIDLIKKHHKRVLGIFSGHVHFEHKEKWYENICQYVCAPTYLNEYIEIICK